MLISKFKIILTVIIISLPIISCSGVKKAFDPERKNTSEEFLVEKKTPLSIPPDFEKLPVPQSEKKDGEEKNDEIQTLLKNNSGNSTQSEEKSDNDLEELILDKIKNN